ncbi:hypothetical protein FACS1894184_14370 [Clostridia bacterium]|nr:hypothetical protein FACS1894184_14370 [Clostridia bacterium]
MAADRHWNRLDNAAKIFPPTRTRGDTKVFRFVCELTAPIDPPTLQCALDRTLTEFPLYRSIIKKGLFWHYFEQSDIKPQVVEEAIPACSSIYSADRHELLFRVLYFGARINLEVFHALADGTGAVQFLKTLVYHYLAEKYGTASQLTDYNASLDQKNQDAFYKYYDKSGNVPKLKRIRAYRIRGETLPDNRTGVTEGFMSVNAMLRIARERDVTLTELLVALLMCAIFDGMAVRERGKPVVVSVPVDLRRFFPAQTARNFFGVVQVVHSFKRDGQTLDEVLSRVRSSLRSQLTQENLSNIISHYSAFENNPLVKAIPLQLKIPILAAIGRKANGEDTAALSNIGRITMPEDMSQYIRLFDVFVSKNRPQICLCSFGDTLAVSMSSPLVDTGIQRWFFRQLAQMGISIQIVSNLEQVSLEQVNTDQMNLEQVNLEQTSQEPTNLNQVGEEDDNAAL